MFTAAVLRALRNPLEIVGGVGLPDLNSGQVLVEVAYSGVCHSQVMEVEGLRGDDAHLPHMLGHEGTGVVRDVGGGVTKVAPGDRVILGWIRGLGLDGGPVRFTSPIGSINAGRVTTFSEFTVVSENRVTKLPPGIPMDEGVMFGCAVPTGAGIVLHQLRPAAGSSLLVWGLGGVGLSALMAALTKDLRCVIAVDVEPAKLALARECGATHVLGADDHALERKVADIVGPGGLDFAVESAGRAVTIERAFSLVRRDGGLCVFASHPPAHEQIRLDPFELICGKRLEGSWGGASLPDRDVPAFERIYREGRLPLGRLISQRYPLSGINDALADLKQRRVARPLIEINPRLA